MKVSVIDEKDRNFNRTDKVKTTVCGNIVELMETEHRSRGCTIKRLGDDYYCLANAYDEKTGEVYGDIMRMHKTDNRGQNIKGMRKSMKALRDLINCNVLRPSFCRWVTLTYAENMTDPKRLKRDHDAFMKRLRRYHVKNGFPNFEYILAVEPQGRGAWHVHSLWIYDKTAPFLPNEDIAKLWGHGFVTVKKLDNVDNVGAYLTAYMCDVDMEDASDLGVNVNSFEVKEVEVTVEGQKLKKKYLKGARLHMYPAGMNFYRASRGVKRPEVSWLDRDEAKEKVKGATLTFSKTIRLQDGDFSNDIHYEYYNTIKGSLQG